MSEQPRIALAHHWLVTMRGGERVLESLAQLLPSADLFTLVCDRSKLSVPLSTRNIRTSFLQYFPNATRWYPYYLPLFPLAARRLDLSKYEIIVSSDAATVKGVTGGNALHICYCHTPMRYVWHDYRKHLQVAGLIGRQVLKTFRSRLRQWDRDAAQRVTHFVSNSKNVQKRVADFYGRESSVIYPPVDVHGFAPAANNQTIKGSFLCVSQLVPYKDVGLLVDAFNKCGRPLTIIGDGPDRRRLEARSNDNIRFLGHQSGALVKQSMQECDAFVFAGEEDFGIVMAEAQACGKPVIALGRGGACEIVRSESTGILFEQASIECLIEALDQFDRTPFDPTIIRESALRFSAERFLREFAALLERTTGLSFAHGLRKDYCDAASPREIQVEPRLSF